mgnify:CR=1 FL=1
MIVNIYNRQKDYKSLIDYAEEKLSEERIKLLESINDWNWTIKN